MTRLGIAGGEQAVGEGDQCGNRRQLACGEADRLLDAAHLQEERRCVVPELGVAVFGEELVVGESRLTLEQREEPDHRPVVPLVLPWLAHRRQHHLAQALPHPLLLRGCREGADRLRAAIANSPDRQRRVSASQIARIASISRVALLVGEALLGGQPLLRFEAGGEVGIGAAEEVGELAFFVLIDVELRRRAARPARRKRAARCARCPPST